MRTVTARDRVVFVWAVNIRLLIDPWGCLVSWIRGMLSILSRREASQGQGNLMG